MDLAQLKAAAHHLMSHAYRPGTKANHTRQFKVYIQFCQHYKLQALNPSTETLCLYATYLSNRLKAPKAVSNYMAAVRLLHKYLDLLPENMDSFQLSLILRAIKINKRHCEHQKPPIDPPLLKRLCQLCDRIKSPSSRMLKCALVFAFYGFLRQSNLAPRRSHDFDPTRHTCRGDIIITHNTSISILIKWSKNRQSMEDNMIVSLPSMPGDSLDPVTAYRNMLKDVPTASANDPLLQLPSNGSSQTVTVNTLRRGLAKLLAACNINPHLYSLHSLRRGGASAAYTAGADPHHIMQHGGWKSQAFWGYISSHRPGAAVKAALDRATRPTHAPRRRRSAPPSHTMPVA